MKEDERIYTSHEEAKAEIQRRWSNVQLRRKLESFLGDDIIHLFKNGPCAVTQQYCITPGHDTERFLQLAKDIELKPLCFEFLQDKFVARNTQKYLLGKLYFSNAVDLKDFSNVPYAKIVNFNTEEGKKLHDVKTIWGQLLVDFHHVYMEMTIPEFAGRVFDFSDWFYRTRHLSEYYYLYYLALFVCHGILIENFEIEGEEEDFVTQILLPSFEKVENLFGVKPLICRLVPSELLDDLHWWCSSESHIDVLRNYVMNNFGFELMKKKFRNGRLR